MDLYLQHAIDRITRQVGKKTMSLIVDPSGTVLAASEYEALSVGVTRPEMLIGLNGNQVSDAEIQWLMPTVTPQEALLVRKNYQALNFLQQIICKEEIAISCIDFMPYAGNRIPYLNTMIPIFGEDMTVVGIEVVTTEYSLYGQSEYFQELTKISNKQNPKDEPTNEEKHPLSMKLAQRQQEIVYLLTNGFSQTETAQILNMSRGSIAKIVSEQICPKFEIAGSCSKILIEKATALGFNKLMPPGLFKPFIIVLNQDIVERYFQ